MVTYEEETEHVGALISNNINIVQQVGKKYCVRFSVITLKYNN